MEAGASGRGGDRSHPGRGRGKDLGHPGRRNPGSGRRETVVATTILFDAVFLAYVSGVHINFTR